MIKLKLIALSVAVFFLFGLAGHCFAEEEAKSSAQESSAKEIERAIEQALKKVNKDKAREDEALVASLEGKLKEATAEWIAKAKAQKNPGLNREVGQSWEMLSKYGPRIHYKYYLMDYDYSENEFDIIDSDSVIVPYRGYSKVTEILYVEREHPVAASDIKPFFYTASTPIKLNFDYKKDTFIFVNEEKGEFSLKQGWPGEVLIRLKAR